MKASSIRANKHSIPPSFVLIFWLVVWWGFSTVIDKPLLLPSPVEVVQRLGQLIATQGFWFNVSGSLFRVLAGLVSAILTGLVLGTLCAFYRPLENLLSPLVTAIQATPVLSFILLALLWFGSSTAPIFICFLMCFPIIWLSILRGIHEIDPLLVEMSSVYEVPWARRVMMLYLPGIRPYFLTACLSAFSLGWKVTVASEVLSFPRASIGGQLYTAKATLESADLFAWTIVVILLSITFEKVFKRFMDKRRSS